MNTILILIDSLNRHYLKAYGDTHIQTPNLTKFAQKAWRFDNHFVGSLPCMPARREIFSGFKEMMWRPWGPLEVFDNRLPRLVEANGGTTAVVTDHYHYWEEAANGYVQSFQSSHFVRGHEIDFWKPAVAADEDVPEWVKNIEKWRPGDWARNYYGNVKDFTTQEDFFPAKVMTGAVDWLQRNAHNEKPFYLHVESFDVHEPFHVPEPYLSMYGDPELANRYTLWPPYQNVPDLEKFIAQTSEEELEFIRAMYSGKLTMVDRWFGDLLTTFDHYNLWDDTMIIITTDHGHDLGERGVFGKQYPHWDSHANIPMFVWHPDYPGKGQTVNALTQTIDLFASVLDGMGAPVPDDESVQSRSFLPLLRGDTSKAREAITYAFYGQGVCCTDGDWTIFKSPLENKPLYYYSTQLFLTLIAENANVDVPVDQGHFIPGVEYPQWKVPIEFSAITHENYLFDRKNDPGQVDNLWDDNMPQRNVMLDLVRNVLKTEGAPVEQFERLGLQL